MVELPSSDDHGWVPEARLSTDRRPGIELDDVTRARSQPRHLIVTQRCSELDPHPLLAKPPYRQGHGLTDGRAKVGSKALDLFIRRDVD